MLPNHCPRVSETSSVLLGSAVEEGLEMVRSCNCRFICSTESRCLPSYSPLLHSWLSVAGKDAFTQPEGRVSRAWKDQASPASCVSWFMQELSVSLYLLPYKASRSPTTFLDIIHWEEGVSIENIFPPVMWEGPGHYGTCQPWAGSPKSYKKTNSVKHRNQAHKQYFSMTWASAPVCMSPPCLSSWLPSAKDCYLK